MDRFGEKVICNPKIKLKKGKIYPLIDIDKITPGYKKVKNESMIEYTGKSGAKFQNHDILFARITPCLENGKVAITDISSQNGIGSTELFVFRGIDGVSDTDYIYYLLRMKHIKQLAANSMTGASGRQRADLNFIKKIKWDFPKIDKQKQIVSILSKYDSLIETNNKRIKILEQMAEELYKEWFVRFRFPGHENAEFKNGKPISWKQERLEEFGITLDSGSRPSGGIDNSIKEGVPSIGAESVRALGEFDYEGVKLIPEDYYSKLRRGKNTGEDILVYKDGAYIGKVTIFMNGFPYKRFAVNEHVFLLNANNKLFQYYLYFTLHMPEYFALMQNLNRNAAQPGLSKPDMKRIKILVPESSLVHSFNVVIKPILDEIFKLSSEKKILQKQRDLLLPRLMSGKLEV